MRIKTKTILSVSIILAGLTLVPLSFVTAESGVSFYLSPSGGNYKVGDLINVSVMVNTGDETINAVQSTLTFNANLEVQSISKAGSILGLWMEEPSYDNTARTISFGGAGAGTTYKGSAGKLISVVLKAKGAGTGTIEFTSSLVKYGAATIEVESVTGGNYTVTVPTPQPQVEEETPEPVEDVLAPEDTTEEPMPTEEEITETVEEVVVPEAPSKEVITEQTFLASMAAVWGGTNQFTILLLIIVMSIMVLVYFGAKEWKLSKRKK